MTWLKLRLTLTWLPHLTCLTWLRLTDFDLVTPSDLPVYLSDLAEAQTGLDLVIPSDLPVDLSDLPG